MPLESLTHDAPGIAGMLNALTAQRPVYPTQAQIMAEPWPLHKTALIAAIKTWKRKVWLVNRATRESRQRALESLVSAMADVYGKPCLFTVDNNARSPFYNTVTKTITMNDTASVISTMHEFAHHLFGKDETKACRWSVHLFRKTFPKAYLQLEWNGHMLVRSEEIVVGLEE